MFKVIAFIILAFMVTLPFWYRFESKKKPPRSTRIVIISEMYFGIVVFAFGFYIYFGKSSILGLIPIIAGILYNIVAFNLCNAKRWARTLCLVLSIIRIPTIIGLIISISSVYLLYVPQSSKDFFDKEEIDTTFEKNDKINESIIGGQSPNK